MTSSYDIRLIPTEETLHLRQKVLKPFLSEPECVNPGDELASTYHLGLFHGERLVSTSTFIQEEFAEIPAQLPYRLRGMATDPDFQGQGRGQLLLRQGVEFLRAKNCDLLWFNARIKAFLFYEKLDFLYHGPLFDIPRIGPHKVMYKVLIPK